MTIWAPKLKPNQPRYLAIVDALTTDIGSGELPRGSQLPPQRDLARALDLSIGTVTRAYALAEERGLVRGEVGRGTFIGSANLESLAYGDTGESLASGINLAINWPLDALSPNLSAALRKLSRRSDLDELVRYQPNLGMPRHRRTGARWIARHGHEVDPEGISLCAGGQHAMTVTLATLASTGDTILTEELTYPGVRAVTDFLGLKAIGVAMDDEGLLPDAFAKACRSRRPKALYCIPTVQNPTPATQSAERRAEIVAVAREHGVPIVEDAIHHLLLDPEHAPPLIASLAPELTYLIASPSKVVAPGLRVAFLAAPPEAKQGLSQRLWATTWMVPPLVAEVMSMWIEDGTAEATLQAKREEARARNALLRELLPGASLRANATGLHAWLDLPGAWADATEFVLAAAERGVALTGAKAFHVGAGAACSGVRISTCAPHDRRTLELGLRRIAETLAGLPKLDRAIV